MAYVLGFFAADGYVTVHRNGGQYWCIQITDEELLIKIRKVIGSNHAIARRKRKGNEKDIFRMQIGSKEMCDDLRNLGFWMNKAYNLAIPFVPENHFRDFLRGYFDGDGHVWVGLIHKESRNPYYSIQTGFTSCSIAFLDSLQQKLQALLGVTGSISKTKKACYRLLFAKQDSLKLYDFMYNGLTSPLFLARKRVVFEKFIKMRS